MDFARQTGEKSNAHSYALRHSLSSPAPVFPQPRFLPVKIRPDAGGGTGTGKTALPIRQDLT
jgi:hypothetical protein